jgi:hypothetical protein
MENVEQLILGQLQNDILVASRAATQAFVTNMASVNAVHSRCAQVIDKRIAEYDLAEVRAETAIDPASQSFWLAKAAADNGMVSVSTNLLLEILRQTQAGRK